VDIIRFRISDDETVNLTKKITNYIEYGTLLLEDNDGVLIDGIVKEHKSTSDINYQILKMWIQGRGRQPATWVTLADVLHDVGLVGLAKNIEDAKL
jgi:hypothetical protein